MSTAITTYNGSAVATLDDDRIALLQRTLAKDLTPGEFELYVDVCNRRQLDPFAKQIYAVKRAGKMVIQTGIDGFRLIAQRSGHYLGQDGPYWCSRDGDWRDTWFGSEPPAAAKVGVKRRGDSAYTYAVAHWDEYADVNNPMWKRMPRNMLAKCAESLALRKAFPEELSGLYTNEEMMQADVPTPVQELPQQWDTGGHMLHVTEDGEIVEAESRTVTDLLHDELYDAAPPILDHAEWNDLRRRIGDCVLKAEFEALASEIHETPMADDQRQELRRQYATAFRKAHPKPESS